MEERLHKILAAAGVASRREAERLIAAGRIAVDGEIVTQMGVKLDPERHTITVDGKPVTVSQRKVYLLLNKPSGYVTTRADPHAPRTVMDLVKEAPVPVHPVGRLDKDTEGALILTNDGAFTQLLTHPRHQVPKRYHVHVKGVPDEQILELLRTGVRLEDGLTAPAGVSVLHAGEGKAVLEVILREGRKRQVRRMLDAVGHPVEQLRRVAVGPVTVRTLPRGAWRFLTAKEVDSLRRMAEGKPEPPAKPAPSGRLRTATRQTSAPQPRITAQSRAASQPRASSPPRNASQPRATSQSRTTSRPSSTPRPRTNPRGDG